MPSAVWTAWLCRRFALPGHARFEDSDEGPVLVLQEGRVIFAADYAILEGDVDEEHPILPLGVPIARAAELLGRFPMEATRPSGERIRVQALPAVEDDGDGPSVVLSVYEFDAAGQLQGIWEGTLPFTSLGTLEAEDWAMARAAWLGRCAAALQDPDDHMPDRFVFEIGEETAEAAAAPDDDGWDAFSAVVDLEGMMRGMEAAVQGASSAFDAVEQGYRAIYGLPLPFGLAGLAAVVVGLGELAADPPQALWESPPGWDRGGA